MNNYRNYSIDELATDHSFRSWVLHLDNDAIAFWENWLANNPDKTFQIGQAREIVLCIYNSFDRISQDEVENEIHKLSKQITNRKYYSILPIRPYWTVFGVAASILVMLFVGWQFFQKNTTKDTKAYFENSIGETKDPIIEIYNESNVSRLISLEDGSSVVLQPKSSLSYPERFSEKQRIVYLKGEAFFEIAKNPQRPFFVYANLLATKVLGTSFKIRAYENQNDVKVIVKTGKVSVFPISEKTLEDNTRSATLSGMVLTPNQQIIYSQKEKRITRSLVSEPSVLELPIQNQSFIFKASPISEVFAVLEKSYGIKIIYDSELMHNCYLTAELSDEPLFQKIDLICRTLGAEYQQMDASIIISSKGCL